MIFQAKTQAKIVSIELGPSAYSAVAAAAGCLRPGVVDSCPGIGEADDDVQGEILKLLILYRNVTSWIVKSLQGVSSVSLKIRISKVGQFISLERIAEPYPFPFSHIILCALSSILKPVFNT